MQNMANKIIPLLMFAVVAVAAWLVSELSSQGNSTNDNTVAPFLSDVLGNQPSMPTGLDNDLQAIGAAEQQKYLETTQTVAANQAALDKRMDRIEQSMTNKIMTGLEAKMHARNGEMLDQMSETLSKFTEHAMQSIDEKISAKPLQRLVVDEDGNVLSEVSVSIDGFESAMPPGLGFDNLPIKSGSYKGKGVMSKISRKPNSKIITLRPSRGGVFDAMGQPLITESKNSRANSRNKGIKKVTFEPTPSTTKQRQSKVRKPKPVHMYSIPVVSTLFSNTTLTSLMGVVPKKGKLNDPIRFKVITGGQNIATNGHYMPGVRNIVWSGWAKGNREMSCVRGTVDKVTFTFDDGTIKTVLSRDAREGLGYIANTHGDPCIPGKLISNAKQYLKDRMIVAGAGSLAEAGAALNTTKIKSMDNSFVETLVDGSTREFLAGETLAGTMKELATYLKERQLESVELVYLPTGQDVTIHVEQAINIDYERDGRKLIHYENLNKIAGYSIE